MKKIFFEKTSPFFHPKSQTSLLVGGQRERKKNYSKENPMNSYSFNNNSFVTISTILTNNNTQDDTLLMVKEWAELMILLTGECPNYTPTLNHLFTAYVEAGRLLDEQQARQLAERKEEEASNKEALWLEQVENRLEAGERVSF